LNNLAPFRFKIGWISGISWRLLAEPDLASPGSPMTGFLDKNRHFHQTSGRLLKQFLNFGKLAS
jgi:hypothetical protein